MKFVILYLATGLFVLAIVLLQEYLEKRRSGPSAAEFFDQLKDRDKAAWVRASQEIIVTVIAGLSVVALWPLAVFFLIKRLFSNRKAEKQREEAEFRISEQHLQEQLTIDQIEEREIVDDPLGAVPGDPFGHLWPAWQRFKEDLQPDDLLWSFESSYESPREIFETRSGYVVSRGSCLGPYFLSFRKVVADRNEGFDA